MTVIVGRAVRLPVVLAAILAMLVSATPVVAAQTVQQVVERDTLIANQEALLNAYRCMFGVDTQVVRGGCRDGSPALPSPGPSPFIGTPTAQDIAIRDKLGADQEALLNTYRCQFNIDTHIVPGGCAKGQPPQEAAPESEESAGAQELSVDDGPQLFDDNLFVLPVDPNASVADHAASFYQQFEDEFDFLIFITNDLDANFKNNTTTPAGLYYGVRNGIQGIGIQEFSVAHEFGSPERLQGILWFSAVHEFRSVALHELMHRWGAFVLPSRASIGSHWATASNIFGILDGTCDVSFEEIVELEEGRYLLPDCSSWPNMYSHLELYLAGLIPPDEVPEFWVALDAEWIEWRSEFTASQLVRYTIEDVIAEHGKRVPGASQAQREFRAAAIVLIDENNPVSMEVLNMLSEDVVWFSRADFGGGSSRYKNFYEATGGRAKIVMGGLKQFSKDSQQ